MLAHLQKDIHRLIHQRWNPELLEYYVYLIIRNIGLSLTMLFIPLYLYVEVGYSIFHVMLYFLFIASLFALCIPFSGKIITALGIKHAIIFHIPVMAAYWFVLRYLTGSFWHDMTWMIPIMVLYAFSKSPMNGAEQAFIHKHIIQRKKYGRGLSGIRIVLIIASIVAPVIGGIVTFYFGYDTLFIVSIIFVLLSGIPFFLTKDTYFRTTIQAKTVLKYTWKKLSPNFFWAHFGRCGPESLLWAFWPIFIYLIVLNPIKVGAVVTGASFIAIIISWSIGKYIDTHETSSLLHRVTKTSAGIFFLRAVLANPLFIVVGDAVNKILEPILSITYDKYFHDYIAKHNNLEIAIVSSFIFTISWVVGIGILVIFFGLLEYFSITPTYWMFVGIFLAFGLLYLLVPRIQRAL